MARLAVCMISIVLVVVGCLKEDEYDISDIPIPLECEGKHYCHIKPDIYDKYVEEMELKLKEIDVSSYRTVDYRVATDEQEEDSDNCKGVATITTPYFIKILKNRKMVTGLVPHTDTFKQTLPTMKCNINNKQAKPCFEKYLKDNMGATGTCEHQYTDITMLYYDGVDISTEKVKVAVGCVCNIKKPATSFW